MHQDKNLYPQIFTPVKHPRGPGLTQWNRRRFQGRRDKPICTHFSPGLTPMKPCCAGHFVSFIGQVGQRKEWSPSGKGSFPRTRDDAILPAISRLDFFPSFVAIRGPRSFMLELFCDRSSFICSARFITYYQMELSHRSMLLKAIKLSWCATNYYYKK
jgi:hypothetical protein